MLLLVEERVDVMERLFERSTGGMNRASKNYPWYSLPGVSLILVLGYQRVSKAHRETTYYFGRNDLWLSMRCPTEWVLDRTTK